MLRNFLMVGTGGFVGSIARYAIGYYMAKVITHPFPFATFLINILGCFIIGLLVGWGERNEWLQANGLLLMATTGICGGFTTFSAFALENVKLLNTQKNFTVLLYTLLSVVLGILLCRVGMWLARG
jgi:CrcB protein